jgi:hypothetical protein
MLWRICRGNVFLRTAEIEEPLEDPRTVIYLIIIISKFVNIYYLALNLEYTSEKNSVYFVFSR